MARHTYKSQLSSDAILNLFFDFYALNEIWFRTVGAAEYGYPVTRILPFSKENAINETFKSKVSLLKKQVIKALEVSVRGEARHWREYTYIEDYDAHGEPISGPSHFEVTSHKIGYDTSMSWTACRKFFKTTSLEKILFVFEADCWQLDYGGKRWAEATKLLIQLKNSKTLKDDVYLIDRIFDLQHNSGFVLNKTVFVTLDRRDYGRVVRVKNKRKCAVKPLNYRFHATLDELVQYASEYVRGLYRANRRMINA